MLLEIRNYLKKVHIASNQQIAREFAMDLSALSPLLDFWLKRGVISPIEQKTGCKTKCWNCNKDQIIYYQYEMTNTRAVPRCN